MLRIDEFSTLSYWNGALSSEEQIRLSTFGFSVPLSKSSAYFEQVAISSPIQLIAAINSEMLIDVPLDSKVTLNFPFTSLLEA